MKMVLRLTMAVVVAALISGCGRSDSKPAGGPAGAGATKPEDVVVVPGVGMGAVKFGMSEEEVIAILGKPQQTRVEANGATKVLWYVPRGYTVTIDKSGVHGFTFLTADTARKILLTKTLLGTIAAADFKGHTPEGIRIGSTEKEVVAAYGPPDERSPGHGQSILDYRNRGLTFYLVYDRVSQFNVGRNPPEKRGQAERTEAPD